MNDPEANPIIINNFLNDFKNNFVENIDIKSKYKYIIYIIILMLKLIICIYSKYVCFFTNIFHN